MTENESRNKKLSPTENHFVSSDTPILLRYNGNREDTYFVTEEIQQIVPSERIEVYSDIGWTRIRGIVPSARAPSAGVQGKTNKILYKIECNSGIVDIDEDHILVLKNGNFVTPRNLKIGDELIVPESSILRRNMTGTSFHYKNIIDENEYDWTSSINKEIVSKGKLETSKICHIANLFGFFSNSIDWYYNEDLTEIYTITYSIGNSSGIVKSISSHIEPESEINEIKNILIEFGIIPDLASEILDFFRITEEKFVYSLETVSGCFMAGIGSIIV